MEDYSHYLNIQGSLSFSITHQLHNGKQGMIDFTTGVKYIVAKGKNGHLSVVSI